MVQRVLGEITDFEVSEPCCSQFGNLAHIEIIVHRGVCRQVFARELEKRSGGAQSVFLQVDECARELNEAFVERVVRTLALRQPELFKHVVGFIEELLVEAVEITKVMGIVTLALALFD